MTTLAPGTRLGAYEIVAAIGAGGMGEVYRARDPRLGRDIALKVLPEVVAAHRERLARFEREAKTLAALNHPHIVTIHSIEQAGTRRFLTMELVEGDSLNRLVTAGGVPLARALDLAIALADALSAAHEKGIVHRDLKPANVMVTRDGRLKVLDFGLAKPDPTSNDELETQALTVESPISTAGSVVGTVPYMAPEQIRGEALDARADLFSFGIMLYELLTGRRPFSGDSHADVSSSILRDTPTPLQSVRSELPRDLGRIVGRCLEKDRERRFQTAKDVRNELEIVRSDVASGSVAAAASLPASSAGAAPTSEPSSAAGGAPSIAVLPFANRSRDEDDEYFAEGLADELQNVLAKIRGLRVAARTSSSTFKGKEATIGEVGQALNVATVLEGSVRKAGNRVRISVHLVKVADGYRMWSETYDRTLDDVFAVQDDIAQSVVKELRTTLLGEDPDSKASGEVKAEVAAAAKARGDNAEVQRLSMQGRYFVERFNPEDCRKGIAFLKQALELDPQHLPSWLILARARSYEAAYGWTTGGESAREAREAVDHALAIDPSSPEAYVAQCRVQRIVEWDWAGAHQSSQRALELAPKNADVLGEAGTLASHIGRLEESAELLAKSVEVDPLSTQAWSAYGYTLRCAGRLTEALEAYEKSLEVAPLRTGSRHMMAIILAEQRRDAEALAAAEAERAEWAKLTALVYLHHAAGRSSESDDALAKLKDGHAADSSLQIACMHSARGELDEAFEWLEHAFEQRDTGISFLLCEPTLRPLHGDPRWKPLLRKTGLEGR